MTECPEMPERAVVPLDDYRMVLAFVVSLLLMGTHVFVYFAEVRASLIDHLKSTPLLLFFISTGILGFGGICLFVTALFSHDHMWPQIVRLLTWHKDTSLVVNYIRSWPCPPCSAPDCIVRSFALEDVQRFQCIWANMTCRVDEACPYSVTPIVFVGPHNAVVFGDQTPSDGDVWRLAVGGAVTIASWLVSFACCVSRGDERKTSLDRQEEGDDDDDELAALLPSRQVPKYMFVPIIDETSV